MTKDTSIRIRISKKDKDKLLKLSRKDKKSVSNYILHKSLDENTVSSLTLAEQINIINFINDIYHRIDASDDIHLKKEVKKLCNSYLLNSERNNENEQKNE